MDFDWVKNVSGGILKFVIESFQIKLHFTGNALGEISAYPMIVTIIILQSHTERTVIAGVVRKHDSCMLLMRDDENALATFDVLSLSLHNEEW